MEWVETVAKTVEEAKSAALDQLGVAEDEAEIEVVAAPKPGLFGRLRGEARVRARVRPASVRPKVERRRRPGKNRQDEGGSSSDGRDGSNGKSSKNSRNDHSNNAEGGGPSGEAGADAGRSSGRRRGKKDGRGPGGRGADNGAGASDSSNGVGAPHRASAGASAANSAATNDDEGRVGGAGRQASRSSQRRKEPTMSAQGSSSDGYNEGASPVSPTEVAAAAVSFLEGLASAMGLSASGTSSVEGTEIDVQLSGDDLGLLVGPAGGTLQAVQDLTRVVAQRKLGDHETRMRVDIAQYRERRRAALEKFAKAVSDQVIESQRPRALEPMSSSDRKIIHDAVQLIDGVSSTSDGSEPNRRVVIVPAD